jgi:hypothetical protein
MTSGQDGDGYVAPVQEDVVTFESQRVGVTNGLLLRFPQLRGAGDLPLLDRPRVAIVGARKATQLAQANFPERNRIMARLATATVIIEASDTSGSLYQASTVQIGHRCSSPPSSSTTPSSRGRGDSSAMTSRSAGYSGQLRRDRLRSLRMRRSALVFETCRGRLQP